MDEVRTWFYRLPQFTRYWFGGTVAVSLLARFGILPVQYLILQYAPFIHQFQIWRPVTALLFYPASFQLLINLFFLVNYSQLLENGEFAQKPADYAFMLLMNWTLCVIAGLFMNMMVLLDPMVLSILYVWCNRNAEQIVNFWFGTRFPAKYLPWVLMALRFIIGGGGMEEFIGILVGHLYYFMMFQYPEQYGGEPLLHTPGFLEYYFPTRRGQGGQSGVGIPPAFRQPAAGSGSQAGHRWGPGRTLHDN